MANGKKIVDQNVLIEELTKWADENEIKITKNFRYGLTLWGTEQKFDVLLEQDGGRVALQYTTQAFEGSAYQKLAIDIIEAGEAKDFFILSVMAGDGIPDTFKSWAIRTGHAVREEDLIQRLTFMFGLE